MYTIIYSIDFEPITAVDIPRDFLDTLEKKGKGLFKIKDSDKTVRLICGSIMWPDQTMRAVLVTPDEENALLLEPTWLPGQVATIGYMKKHLRTLTDKLIKALRNRSD